MRTSWQLGQRGRDVATEVADERTQRRNDRVVVAGCRHQGCISGPPGRNDRLIIEILYYPLHLEHRVAGGVRIEARDLRRNLVAIIERTLGREVENP